MRFLALALTVLLVLSSTSRCLAQGQCISIAQQESQDDAKLKGFPGQKPTTILRIATQSPGGLPYCFMPFNEDRTVDRAYSSNTGVLQVSSAGRVVILSPLGVPGESDILVMTKNAVLGFHVVVASIAGQ